MRKYSDSTVKKAIELLNEGKTYKEVAKKLDMNEHSINYWVVKAHMMGKRTPTKPHKGQSDSPKSSKNPFNRPTNDTKEIIIIAREILSVLKEFRA